MTQPEDTQYGQCEATAKSTGERCGRAATGEHGKCNYHGGASTGPPPEKLAGNQNALGNSGGGAPLGNRNGMKHGLYMTIKAQYESFSEEEREAFKFYVEYYRNDRGLDDLVQAKVLAIAEVMRDLVEADLASSLYTTRYADDGTSFEVPKDTMLDAHKEYITTIRLKQHYEGISRHPSTENGGGANINQFLEQLPDGIEDTNSDGSQTTTDLPSSSESHTES